MHFIKWLSSSGVDSTMTCSWHSCWYLSCARAGEQVMCSEPAYHDIAFSKVRGTHKSSVSVFSTSSMCLEPKFPQNSHVSHIWHHLGIFREGCVWLEAFLARVRHVNSPSHYVSTLAITRDSFFKFQNYISIHVKPILTFDVLCGLWSPSLANWANKATLT